MKVHVDEDACIGCELCVDTCPAVFQMEADGLSHVIVDPVPAAHEECTRESVDVCPVTAIEIEE